MAFGWPGLPIVESGAAVLVIMHYRDVELLDEAFLDVETPRGD